MQILETRYTQFSTHDLSVHLPSIPPTAEKLQRAKVNSKKESCPFCQEQKKRPLIAYMRKRAQEKNGKICEEEDAEEELANGSNQSGQAVSHCHGGHAHNHGAAQRDGDSRKQ